MKRKRGAKVGNRNAVLYKKASLPLRINGGLVELIDDYLSLQGNGAPTNQERKEAVEEAIRKVYTRPVEDSIMII